MGFLKTVRSFKGSTYYKGDGWEWYIRLDKGPIYLIVSILPCVMLVGLKHLSHRSLQTFSLFFNFIFECLNQTNTTMVFIENLKIRLIENHYQ